MIFYVENISVKRNQLIRYKSDSIDRLKLVLLLIHNEEASDSKYINIKSQLEVSTEYIINTCKAKNEDPTPLLSKLEKRINHYILYHKIVSNFEDTKFKIITNVAETKYWLIEIFPEDLDSGISIEIDNYFDAVRRQRNLSVSDIDLVNLSINGKLPPRVNMYPDEPEIFI